MKTVRVGAGAGYAGDRIAPELELAKYRDVPNLATLGFPIAKVSESGLAVITKVAGSRGCVTIATCTAQLR